MDEDTFWAIISRARAPRELHAELTELTDDQLLGFERRHARLMHEAYTWELWGAAYVINGGCGDDTFEYFRAALIGRGGDIFRQAVADPDSLAAVDIQDEEDWEEWMSPTMQVIHARTGRYGFAGPPEEPSPSQPAGSEWTDDTLAERFPRLSAKYGF